MSKLYIRNWTRWQSMRKNRPGMIWVKVYRDILKDESWAGMTDAEKGQYVSLLLVADPLTGKLPSDDEGVLRKICQLDALDLTRMVALRLTTGQPTVATEESRVEKSRGYQMARQCSLNWRCTPLQYDKLKRSFTATQIEAERVRFVNWCEATGRLYKNHDAAFRNWMTKSREINGQTGFSAPVEGQDIFGRELEDVTPH